MKIDTHFLHGCREYDRRTRRPDSLDLFCEANEADGKLDFLDSLEDRADKLLRVGNCLHQLVVGAPRDVKLLNQLVNNNVDRFGFVRGLGFNLLVLSEAVTDVVVRDMETAELQGDSSVAEAIESFVQVAVDIQCRSIQNFQRLSSLGCQQHAPEGHYPFGLLVLICAALQRKTSTVHHLPASVDGNSKTAHLQISNTRNVDSCVGRHDVNHLEPIQAPMQALDAVLDPRQPLPCLAPFVRVGIALGGSRRPRDLWGGWFRVWLGDVGVGILIFRCDSLCLGPLQCPDVNRDGELVHHDAQPGRLGKSRAVDVKAQAPDVDTDAIARGVGESAEGEVANALDRNAGDYAEDGE